MAKMAMKPFWLRFLNLFKFFFTFFVSFIFFLYIFFKIDNQFKIKKIEVTSNIKDTNINAKELFLGKRVFFTDSNTVKQKLQSANKHIIIEDVLIEFPSSIKISVKAQTPYMYLKVSSGYYLLNSEGQLLLKLKEINNFSLPVLTLSRLIPYHFLQVGDFINTSEIALTTKAISILKTNNIFPSILQINNRGDLEIFFDEKKIYIPTNNAETKLYQLEKTLNFLLVDGQKFVILDLRYEKPLISY